MSDPRQFLIYGDLNVVPGVDVSSGPGSVLITGANSLLDVNGQTQLDQTTIDTSDGQFAVVGTNRINFSPTAAIELTAAAGSFFNTTSGTLTLSSATADVVVNSGTGFDVNSTTTITMDAGATSYFRVTGGDNLTLDSTMGRLINTSSSTLSNAITISATNSSGGISISSGSNGINALANDGPFSISGENTSSSINLSTDNNSQDLTINLTGATNSSVIVNSSGTGADAFKVNTTSGGVDINANGAITMDSGNTSNFTVNGAFDLTLESTLGSVVLNAGEAAIDSIKISAGDVAGGIDIDSGTGGITMDTTGGFSIDGESTSNITVTGTSSLTLNNIGGQLILQSTQAEIDAVRIYASNAAGGIDIDSGTGGINATSQGPININANAGASNFSLLTSNDNQDLSISLTGGTDSSLIFSSSGTGTDAIKISATAGGIDVDAGTGGITMDTADTVNGIRIATQNVIPVTIGSANSTTTIAGNLIVSGANTVINTETLTIEDNVIVINAGASELGADGGILIRRFQTPNNLGEGDVVDDGPGPGRVSGLFQSGSATPGTLVLDSSASSVDGFYNGWWIEFTTNSTEYVRRINTYVGSTRTATIFMDSEKDGLDLVETPIENEQYFLYNSPFVGAFYRESTDRWTVAYTALNPDPISEPGSSIFTIQRFTPMDVGSIRIQSNGIPGASLLNVDVINEFTEDAGVTIEGVLIKDGLVGGSVPDVTEVVNLLDNSTTGVDIVATSIAGSYFIIVTAVQTGNLEASQTNGSHAVFVASSSGVGGANTRLSGTKGAGDERIDITWNTGEKIKLRHAPAKTAGSGATVPYRVKVIRSV